MLIVQSTIFRRWFFIGGYVSTSVLSIGSSISLQPDGLTGLTVALQLAKNGTTTFSNPSAGVTTLTEVANGWYYANLSTTDTNTLGLIEYQLTWGSNSIGEQDQIVVDLPGNTITGITGITFPSTVASPTNITAGTITGITGVTFPSFVASPTNITAGTITGITGITIPSTIASPTNISTVANLTNLPSIPANWLTSTGINSGALNGKGDWNTTTPPTTTAIASAILSNPTNLLVTDSNGRAAFQSGITKNITLNNFKFYMLASSDHVSPGTGLTVTAQRSIDAGAFANCANAVVELSNGVYSINLANTDLNGNVITLKFTATGGDPSIITLFTTP